MPAGSAMDVNEEQPSKANAPRLVRPAGSSIDVIDDQPSKACPPMLVRPADSAIDVIEEQSWKAYLPRLVRPAGSSIDVIEEQPRKAHSPMLMRPAGSAIDLMDLSPRNAFAGTRASPSRSAHAASSTSIGASPSPRMQARTPAIGYAEDTTRLSAATSTSKPPSPVTFARLGSQRDASTASAKRRPAARLSERSSSVTSTRLLVSGRPTRAHSR
ncbi:hypothetical protein Ctob_012597, partial [Chrysochromulina tobinii]